MGKQKNPNLSLEQYNVCFLKETKAPGSGKWLNNKAKGMYVCVNCGQELFKSDTKYDSQTGWPAFWDTSAKAKIEKKDDSYLGMHFFEVLCGNCGVHLGHVFNDGPKPTGQRYCINSLALDFHPQQNGSE